MEAAEGPGETTAAGEISGQQGTSELMVTPNITFHQWPKSFSQVLGKTHTIKKEFTTLVRRSGPGASVHRPDQEGRGGSARPEARREAEAPHAGSAPGMRSAGFAVAVDILLTDLRCGC